MQQYAQLIGGVFDHMMTLTQRPPDIPHKDVAFYPVLREEGIEAFEGVAGDAWVIRTALPTLAQLRAAKLSELSGVRWIRETGGTTVSGMPLSTDTVSQIKYIGAVVGAQIDPAAVINWKMADGTFVTLDAQAITAVAMAVRAHVQMCFDNEAALKAQIEAATTAEEIAAVDLNIGWP